MFFYNVGHACFAMVPPRERCPDLPPAPALPATEAKARRSPGERSSWDNGCYFGAATVVRGARCCKTQGRVSDPGAPPTLFTDALRLSTPPPSYGWLINRTVMVGVLRSIQLICLHSHLRHSTEPGQCYNLRRIWQMLLQFLQVL